jgi:PAB1-binding protein PBP1
MCIYLPYSPEPLLELVLDPTGEPLEYLRRPFELESPDNRHAWDDLTMMDDSQIRFGSEYGENIYALPIDKNELQYKAPVAAADGIARNIYKSEGSKSHEAGDPVSEGNQADDGINEEEK